MTADGKIHNGADDNASGTAVILEVARQLASREEPLPRSVLFVGFSAEEVGLIGSSYYVRHPVVPLTKTIAMINLDMVGRLRKDRLTVFGTGTAAEFESLIARLGRARALRLSTRSSGYGPSDHAAFYERGIPVLHFFTGFHPDYHRPSDDFDKVNYAGMRRISRMIADLAVELAEAEQPPQKTDAGENLADLLGSSPAAATPERSKTAYLGVVVDREHSEKRGFAIGRVIDGTAAEKHGLRVGDVIVRFDSKPIADFEELAPLVRQQKPGETVPVVVRRGTTELEVDVTLGPRP